MSPRVALVIIAALFVVPLALAWLMYTGAIEFSPHETRNRGQLVEPPVPVSWSAVRSVETEPSDGAATEASNLSEHWVILRVLPGRCDEVCLADVSELRQVHRASGRQQSRIRLALLQPAFDREMAADLLGVYPLFEVLVDRTGALTAALSRIAGEEKPFADPTGATYLIDPLGNIMMYYEAGSDPNDLKSDLKRLLTWSKLDEQQ
jgi:hypothetical protein